MKIVVSVVLAFFLIGCSSDNTKEVQNVESQQIIQETVVDVVIDDKDEPIEVVLVEDIVVAEISVDDGARIYKVCSSCHGANGDLSALGKSKIIKGWSITQVTEALNGYKDGSYGGTLKAVMKAQVNKLSDEDIEVVAEYISTL